MQSKRKSKVPAKPKDESLILQAIIDNPSLDAQIRLAAAKELAALAKPESAPKPAEDKFDEMLAQLRTAPYRPPTPEEQQIKLEQQLHAAAGKGDKEHCERIVAIFKQHGWTPPQYQLSFPAPAQTQTVTEKRMRQYAEAARQDQDDKLREQLNWQAMHPIYRAGDRKPLAQGSWDDGLPYNSDPEW